MTVSRRTESEAVRKFLKLYVNEDTIDMGTKGDAALITLFTKAKDKGIIQNLAPIDLI